MSATDNTLLDQEVVKETFVHYCRMKRNGKCDCESMQYLTEEQV